MADQVNEAVGEPVESVDGGAATMTAAVVSAYGPPERVVQLRRLPVPDPGPGEVLVRVAASSINALDWHFTTGLPMFARPAIGLRRPRRQVPGADVAGTVVAVGDGVERPAVGDEVFGVVDGGGFAEYVVTPADTLLPAPSALPLEEAATIGVAAVTALQGLRDWGGLQRGDRVLVNGASGGVGTFAVQIAKALGARHVTAVCSTGNVETAARLGADRVLDYTREDVAAALLRQEDRFDVIFDNAGAWRLSTCRRLLAPGGRYAMVTAPKSRWLHPLPRMIGGALYFAATRTPAGVGKVAQETREDLAVLADFVERGQVRPLMERRFALSEAREALRLQGEFHARGKSIVVPDPD